MHRFFTLLIIGCVGLSACSWCKKKPAPPPTPPPKVPVCLQLHGHPRLQWYQGSAHTLYVRLFPLTSADAFGAEETSDLLADPPPALQGAAGTPHSYVLYPGATTKAEIEAGPQDFPTIGIAAGYYKPLGKTKLVMPSTAASLGTCVTVNFGEAGIESTTSPTPPGSK